MTGNLPAEAQAILCRRRHQARRLPLAKIRPGSPAPAMGPGTATVPATIVAENVRLVLVPPCVVNEKVPGVRSKSARLMIPVPMSWKVPAPASAVTDCVRRVNVAVALKGKLTLVAVKKQPGLPLAQIKSDPVVNAVGEVKLIGKF